MKIKSRTNPFVRKKMIAIVILSLLLSMIGSQTSVQASGVIYNFTVNSNEWWPDTDPDDEDCIAVNNGACTFLAALQEASTKNIGDIVNINLTKGVIYPVYATPSPPVISLATVNIYGNEGVIDLKDSSGSVFNFSDQSKLKIESLTIKNGSRNPLSIGNGVQVTINQCTFLDNTYKGITASGGAINNKGELIILNSTFTNNQAQHGGAIYNTGSLEVINTIFTNNSAVGYGGAISSIEGRVMISNSTFKSNQAGELGGAIHQSKNKIKINHTIFENNVVSGDGGAVSIFFNEPSQTHEIIASTFTSNQAINKGGAIYSYQSSLDFSYNSYQGNTAKNGGALNIYNHGISSFEKESFIQNTSQEQGGAIFLENNWVGIYISKSDFYGNAAQSGGGVSVKDSKVEFDSSTFRENTSTGTETSHGGGGVFIANNSTNRQVDFNNTTFSGNIANSHGGGLFITDKGIVYLNNSTITQNISNQDQSKIGDGGGLLVDNTLGVVVNIQNSILAKNTHRAPSPAPIIFLYHHDWHGTLISKGYNILGSKGYNSLITGSEVGNHVGTVSYPIDPLLNSLQPFEYFGEILTYAHFPQNQSLAINRGNPAGCKNSFNINFLYDQRGRDGWPRIVQSRCDIGAIESIYPANPAIQQLILSSNSSLGGTQLTGSVHLDNVAPKGGVVVSLLSNKIFAIVPATITVPAGQKSQTFTIQTTKLDTPTNVTISAYLNGVYKTSALFIVDAFEIFLPLVIR
jgi:predicted outer membrane repeat protein